MKRIETLFAASLTAITLLLTPLAHAGNEGSGGGDQRAIQFKAIGHKIADFLKAQSKELPHELRGINVKKLRRAIRKTEIASTDQVLRLNSGDTALALIKDAINTPRKKTILFNREAWDMIPSPSRRSALVLHEYLGIMNVRDKDYEISSVLFEHADLRRSFDSLTVAKLDENAVDFDFRIQCEIRYRGQSIELMDGMAPAFMNFLGQTGLKTGGLTSHLMARDVAHSDDGQTLRVSIYNENSVSSTGALLPNAILGKASPSGNAPSLKFVVGWVNSYHSYFEIPSAPLFEQSVRVTPNFKTRFKLSEQQLEVDCYRVTKQDFSNDSLFL